MAGQASRVLRVHPDLAPINQGFRNRRYSNGVALKASDFRRAFERDFSARAEPQQNRSSQEQPVAIQARATGVIGGALALMAERR